MVKSGSLFHIDLGANNVQETHSASAPINSLTPIGLIGICHCSLLTTIILWRFSVFLRLSHVYDRWTPLFNKRLLFHTLLLLTVVVDIPMYCSFILYDRYILSTYLFHKTSAMWIYLAYSIVVRDWIDVLYEIKEDNEPVHQYKSYFITSSAIGVVLVTGVNVAVGATYGTDVGAYALSMAYFVGLYFQLLSTCCISTGMLHSGLKLAYRLQGASGSSAPAASAIATTSNAGEPTSFARNMKNTAGDNAEDDVEGGAEAGSWRVGKGSVSSLPGSSSQSYTAYTTSGTSDHMSLLESGTGGADEWSRMMVMRRASGAQNAMASKGSAEPSESNQDTEARDILPLSETRKRKELSLRKGATTEFMTTLRRLNLVMLSCVFCNVLGSGVLMANVAMGFASKANSYVINVYFYYTMYAVIPLWGPILALLYWVQPRPTGKKRGKSKRRSRSKSIKSGRDSQDMAASGACVGRRRRASKSPRTRLDSLLDERGSDRSWLAPDASPLGILWRGAVNLWGGVNAGSAASEGDGPDPSGKSASDDANGLAAHLLPDGDAMEEGDEVRNNKVDGEDGNAVDEYNDADIEEEDEDYPSMSDESSVDEYGLAYGLHDGGFRSDSNTSADTGVSNDASVTSSILSDYGPYIADTKAGAGPSTKWGIGGRRRHRGASLSTTNSRGERKARHSTYGRLSGHLEEAARAIRLREAGCDTQLHVGEGESVRNDENSVDANDNTPEEAPLVFLSSPTTTPKYHINHRADYTYSEKGQGGSGGR